MGVSILVITNGMLVICNRPSIEDARLIAAAPELLAACEHALTYVIANGIETSGLCNKLKKAITKTEKTRKKQNEHRTPAHHLRRIYH